MRVLLRDADTGLYFKDPRQWTTNNQEALCFRHSAEAMDQARLQGLENAEIVLSFDETRQSVALPIPC